MRGAIEDEIIARQIGSLTLENARLSARVNALLMCNAELEKKIKEQQEAKLAEGSAAAVSGTNVAAQGDAVSAATNTAAPENLRGTIYDADQG